MTQLQKVLKAIEINGHIDVSVNGRPQHCRAIRVVDGVWVTDILTSDLRGYVRIVKTKAAVVRQAEDILAREHEIRARREASIRAAFGQA